MRGKKRSANRRACELPITGSAWHQSATLLELPPAARERRHPRHNLADVERACPASIAGLLPADERRKTKLHARQSAESLTVASCLPPHPAISLGEREHRIPRCDESRRTGLSKAQPTVLPLLGERAGVRGKKRSANQRACELPMTGRPWHQGASILELPPAAREGRHPRHDLADVGGTRSASAAGLLSADERRKKNSTPAKAPSP